MTTESELIALAERCEAATGPDRELDALIHVAVGRSEGNPIAAPGMSGWCVGSETNPNPVLSLAYTASLDTAMTLVPEGYNWGVGPWEDWKTGPRTAWAWCDETGEDWTDEMNVQAATPALALTAAALRVRSAALQEKGA